MKKYMIIIITALSISCTKNEIVEQKNNFLKNKIPDLYYFNCNSVLTNDTLLFTRNNDTIQEYIYDSIGRFSTFNRKNLAHRIEKFMYFDKTSFSLFKFIQVDYSLYYHCSLIQVSSDTLLSFWYNNLASLEDTFTYIFKDKKLIGLKSSSLNDYENLKTKMNFHYSGDLLNRVSTITLNGGKMTPFGDLDSIVALYEYKGKIVKEIKENYYFKQKKYNYKNTILFNKEGFPEKYVEKDSTNFSIVIKT